jgi:hypothetical protein
MPYLRSLIVLMLLTSAPAQAIVIDNFEEGAFSISGDTTPSFASQSPLASENAIADVREDNIASGASGQMATADLALSAGDDGLVVLFPDSGGTLNLIYRPAPTDLTEGGSSDRIVIVIDALPPGAALALLLDDAIGGSTSISPPIVGPGSHSIAYADLAPGSVDLTQINFLRFIISGTGAGSWEIRDIRTAGPPAPVPGLSAPIAVVLAVLLIAGTGFRVQRWPRCLGPSRRSD